MLVKDPRKVQNLLIGMCLAAIGALLLTPLGFPYSADPNSLAPQRFMIAVSTIVQTLKYLLLLLFF